MNNPINYQPGGSHYKDRAIQPIEYIFANKLGFCEGNVIKYISRWKDKNGIQDLKKAIHYIEFLIYNEESKDGDRQKSGADGRRDGTASLRGCLGRGGDLSTKSDCDGESRSEYIVFDSQNPSKS